MPDTDAFGDSFGSCGGTETQRESVPAGRERAGAEKIPLEAITYIRQRGKYACIAKADGSRNRVRRTLKSLSEELPEEQFFQIDRGYLCNVTKVTQLKNDKLTLTTGEELYVSSARMRKLKDKVMEYWIREKKI